MTDDEVFRVVSGPGEIDDWGIPDEVDPEECSDALQVSSLWHLKRWQYSAWTMAGLAR